MTTSDSLCVHMKGCSKAQPYFNLDLLDYTVISIFNNYISMHQ